MRIIFCIAAFAVACSNSSNSVAPDGAATDTGRPASDGSHIDGCVTSADCPASEYCTWEAGHACGLDHTGGTCTPVGPHLCPDLGFWVCGCDGVTYTNGCHAAGAGISVAYGGPCRDAGAKVACQVDDDCPQTAEFPEYCADDPTDTCDPAVSACPGVCVHGTYVCGPDQPCLSQTGTASVESPGTEVCMTVTVPSENNLPGRCIYTTRQTCTSPADCGTGELCMPELGCDPATTQCPQDCVRP